MGLLDGATSFVKLLIHQCEIAPLPLVVLLAVTTLLGFASVFYLFLFIAAPIPRAPLASEKTYVTNLRDGRPSTPSKLPCWLENHNVQSKNAHRRDDFSGRTLHMKNPEVGISVVVPAYNEEERLTSMLEDAVDYLESDLRELQVQEQKKQNGAATKTASGKKKNSNGHAHSHTPSPKPLLHGWEVLVVSDGSTDGTTTTALEFAKSRKLSPGLIRVVSLRVNRGKGGAVTHGMRHVRGQYAVFADADGASTFSDLGKLVTGCKKVEDSKGRGVAVGSRAHLVGSQAVVQRSLLRNLLMHSFHLFLRILTPPATAAIKDTQCGFKLFSRAALPDIIPYMHSEGWIFDVEMLMLAESASIPVCEVAVGWKEVKGSKLNVLWDSLGMAWGLAVLRAAWGLGVYRRG